MGNCRAQLGPPLIANVLHILCILRKYICVLAKFKSVYLYCTAPCVNRLICRDVDDSSRAAFSQRSLERASINKTVESDAQLRLSAYRFRSVGHCSRSRLTGSAYVNNALRTLRRRPRCRRKRQAGSERVISQNRASGVQKATRGLALQIHANALSFRLRSLN